MADHTETVDLEFDPRVTSYEALLGKFWKWHDPTSSHTRQYMSAVFYHNEEQRRLALKTKEEHQKHIARPIVTEISEAKPFYDAEDYHQKYILRRHPKVHDHLNLSDEELIKSKVACRLNGYLGGYGSEEDFLKECDDGNIQLSDSVKAYVCQQIRKKGRF